MLSGCIWGTPDGSHQPTNMYAGYHKYNGGEKPPRLCLYSGDHRHLVNVEPMPEVTTQQVSYLTGMHECCWVAEMSTLGVSKSVGVSGTWLD